MSQSTTTIAGKQEPGLIDLLTDFIRNGARLLLASALELEVQNLLEYFSNLITPDGKRTVVRNGYLPEREILTGIGPVSVRVPKVRDRSDSGIKFTSALFPPYMRRTTRIEEVLPWLYLKGISAGEIQEALTVLLGDAARGLSATTISRLKESWQEEYQQWSQRDLSGKRYVYLWADGIYFTVRSETDRQCILVVIGVTETGEKELLAIEDGFRESTQSWEELLLSLRRRGVTAAPLLATGDGNLGFWAALAKVYPQTRHQRCWVHKTSNVLNRLPKSLHATAKRYIQEIWMAESRQQAEKAMTVFEVRYGAKYPKAVECLLADRDALLAFYDFPAVHWHHIRTTNPIESTFSTVRLRTKKTRNCGSRTTILTMVFKLGLCAEKRWRRLRGFSLLADLLRGAGFIDGVRADIVHNKTDGADDDDRIAA